MNPITEVEKPLPLLGLMLWQHGLVFLFCCVILVTRRSEAIFNPQFYAEDGRVFFAEAYNRGWLAPMFSAYAGYLHVFSRLVAALALLLPFSKVPPFFNLVSVACTAFPVNLLLSSRSGEWGSLKFRVLLAAIYISLPNNIEVSRGLTNTFSLLSLSALLILVATVPRSSLVICLDTALLLICGLNGPFCILLLTIALYLGWKDHRTARVIYAATLSFTVLVQATYLLFIDAHVRSHVSLGASPLMLLRIMGGHIFLGSIIGANLLAEVAHPGIECVLAVVASLCSVFVVACFRQANLPQRLFMLYALLVVTASLVVPLQLGTSKVGVWEVLAKVPAHRYWFFGTLAFSWSLGWLVCNGSRSTRICSGTLIALSLFGVIKDWKVPKLFEGHFEQSVSLFQCAPRGTVLVLPEGSPGWFMEIVKH